MSFLAKVDPLGIHKIITFPPELAPLLSQLGAPRPVREILTLAAGLWELDNWLKFPTHPTFEKGWLFYPPDPPLAPLVLVTRGTAESIWLYPKGWIYVQGHNPLLTRIDQ